ncbi:MAG: hypothetical protein WCF57_10425, partial [Pyrinomonadaceae bacterium]
MGLFWRRKKEDRFVTLGLNEPSPARVAEQASTPAVKDGGLEPPAALESSRDAVAPVMPDAPPALEPAPTGAAPTPPP